MIHDFKVWAGVNGEKLIYAIEHYQPSLDYSMRTQLSSP